MNLDHQIAEVAARITPPQIDSLAEGEIFVFGSNAQGMHAGGLC
jgi:hypothetical protein